MTSNMTIFQEGQSTARPSLLSSTDYNSWATRRIYMQNNSYSIWIMTRTEFVESTTDFQSWTADQKAKAENNSKAMNIIYCALDKNEFNRVSICKNVYEYGILCKFHTKELIK